MITWIIMGVLIHISCAFVMYKVLGKFEFLLLVPPFAILVVFLGSSQTLRDLYIELKQERQIEKQRQREERIQLENDFETSNFEEWNEE